ncbi:MAG TPA: TonB-dependent receptor [Steroidobacteraceae bacterium]|nr:TonB-dependent receptor [Steroidobacteraceae bacterium]
MSVLRSGVGGLAAAILACSLIPFASADSTGGGDSLQQIVVTATRTSVPLKDALASVTVLTRAQIQARQVLSLQDLFEGEAGIQISNNGGLGKASSVFIRGANADQVLVLIDGVRVGSATLGTTLFQYLPVDQISRIEIVRGPLSSLYGSEAMGGVIQIFTGPPKTQGLTVQADAATGSHATSTIGGSFDVGAGPLYYGVSASNLTSNGYANCSGAPYLSPASPGGGCYVYDPRPDGFHDVSTAAHAGYRFGNTFDAVATFMRSQGGTRYAGSYTNHQSFVEQVVSLAGHWTPTTALRVTVQGGQSRDNEIDTLDFVEPPGNLFDTLRNSASLQADWTVAAQQVLSVGGDYLRDTIASDTIFPVTSRHVTGVFAEYQGGYGPIQMTVSGRHDENSQFGGKSTGSIALGHHFTPSLRVMASVGTGFHAPTFDDLYFPGFGNAALKPETSRSYEVGVDQSLAASGWSVHVYETHLRDLISYDNPMFTPENTDYARIRGVELQGHLTAGPYGAKVTGSWLDPRNLTPGSPNYDKILARRARAIGRIELSRRWPLHLRSAARVQITGPTFDDAADSARLGGYTTVDALLEWRPAKRWILQAKIGNLTDRRYQTALYYPQDRRNYLVTVRYRPAGR